MHAIRVEKPHEMHWATVPKPEVQNHTDVLIRVRAAGICGSDIHIAHGTNVYATYPRIPGHEIAGEVEAVGNGVTRLKPGDRVVLEPIHYCGACYACTHGHPNVCKNLSVSGVHQDGGFCEYLVDDARNFHRIPDDLPYEQAALIEPYTIGAQANWRGGVSSGDVVLIHGAGPIGLICMDTARSLGASVIVSEINENRLQLAKELGAEHIINPAVQDLKKAVLEITDGMGPNVVLEAAGIPSLLPLSIELASVAGRVVALGFGKEPVPVDFSQLNRKELGVFGTRLQSYKFEPVIKSFLKHLTAVKSILTGTYPAEEFAQAFHDFTEKDSTACKIVLKF